MAPTLCLFLLSPVLLSRGERRKEKGGEKKLTLIFKKEFLSDIAGEEMIMQQKMFEDVSESEKYMNTERGCQN